MSRDNQQEGMLQLYQSTEHACAYLDGKQARSLFVDPYMAKSMRHYEALIDQGFRRSGEIIYRPHCRNCRQCIPLRIPVNEFRPRRIQRRIWTSQQALYQVIEQPARFDPAHFDLFKRYILSRHPDGEMSTTTAEGYEQFIASNWSRSTSFAFYQEEQLIAVAVTDILRQGLSAVYTFFEPELSRQSLGVFCLLWQIEECKKRQLPWLYLGYWVPDCRKMAYKNQYFPHEVLIDGTWTRISRPG